MRTGLTPITAELTDYLRDESRRSGQADAIMFATSGADVAQALAAARAQGWPVTVQGARTGIAAGAVPQGGLILNLSRMNQLGALQGRRITVQPGALLSDVRAVVEAQGLFFPPDPTETSASLGGMLACNASGALSYHYGPTRRWVHSLRVVLADGDTLRLQRGQRARGTRFELTTDSGRVIEGELPALDMPKVKNAAGYFSAPDMELIDLFIGMEGTLGVIVEAELELLPIPPLRQALTAFFPSEAAALSFVRQLRGDQAMALPVPPTAIEFFDSNALNLLRRAKSENPAFAELPTLAPPFHTAVFVEFHGADEAALEETVVALADRLQDLGAGGDACWFADRAKELDVMKKFRHATPEAVNLLIDERRRTHPALTKLGTDMAVPDAALDEIMAVYHRDLNSAGLEYVIFGHIGNNHVHVNILPRSMAEYDQGKALYLQWADRVVALGGSISAEHGVGKLKVPMLARMYGEAGIREMRALKQLLDPNHLLNPGNLF